MSMLSRDAILQVLGIWPNAKHFVIVVAFDKDRVHSACNRLLLGFDQLLQSYSGHAWAVDVIPIDSLVASATPLACVGVKVSCGGL